MLNTTQYISLLEKLTNKKVTLKENPDTIKARDMSIIAHGYEDSDAHPFGVDEEGNVYIGKKSTTHGSIKDIGKEIKDIKISQKYETGPRSRADYKLTGRVWLDSKLINFWKYPKSKAELFDIINKLKEEFKLIYDDVDLSVKNIEVYINKDDRTPNTYEFDWEYPDVTAKIISVNDYDKWLAGGF